MKKIINALTKSTNPLRQSRAFETSLCHSQQQTSSLHLRLSTRRRSLGSIELYNETVDEPKIVDSVDDSTAMLAKQTDECHDLQHRQIICQALEKTNERLSRAVPFSSTPSPNKTQTPSLLEIATTHMKGVGSQPLLVVEQSLDNQGKEDIAEELRNLQTLWISLEDKLFECTRINVPLSGAHGIISTFSRTRVLKLTRNFLQFYTSGKHGKISFQKGNPDSNTVICDKLLEQVNYKDISAVDLIDHQTIRIQLNTSTNEDHTYRSISALNIFHELRNRLAVIDTTYQKQFTYDIALKYQQSIAKGLGKFKKININTSIPPDSLMNSEVAMNMNITNSTPNQQDIFLQNIILKVDQFILNPNSEYGKSRQALLTELTPSVISKDSTSAMSCIREFISNLKRHVQSHHLIQFIPQEESLRLFSRDVDSKEREKMLSQVKAIVECSVERSMIMPLYRNILEALRRNPEIAAQESYTSGKIQALKPFTQKFFGIKRQHVSSNNWISAIYELSQIEKKNLPSEKLQILLRTSRSIYQSNALEQVRRKRIKKQGEKIKTNKQNTSTSTSYLGGDDFFPIFTYVIVNASIKKPVLNGAYMLGLCDTEALMSEEGYYLTVYHAALELFRKYDPTSKKFKT